MKLRWNFVEDIELVFYLLEIYLFYSILNLFTFLWSIHRVIPFGALISCFFSYSFRYHFCRLFRRLQALALPSLYCHHIINCIVYSHLFLFLYILHKFWTDGGYIWVACFNSLQVIFLLWEHDESTINTSSEVFLFLYF